MNVVDEKRSNSEVRGYVRKRIAAMQKNMSNRGIDAVIMSRPENVFYFSNFNPIITSYASYMIMTQEKACLLVHSIRHDHAFNEGALDDVQCYGHWGAVEAISMDAFDAMRKLLGEEKLIIGIEENYASITWLRGLYKSLHIKKIIDIATNATEQRLIKDPYEINMCRISGRLVDLGVDSTIDALNNGASEAQACTEGQYAMRQLWHEEYQKYEVAGFSNSETAQIDTLCVWCMSNERLNYGCDCPTGYVPQVGDLVIPMSWARIAGYNAENERTVIVRKVNEIRNKAYHAMLLAREEIFKRLRPGAIFEDLYLAAMKVYENAGFGNILPGRCGHGIGLSNHEFPAVTHGNTMALRPGMIITVEPGLMSTALGAVRHSDTVLITAEGYEMLTKSRRETIIIK